MIVGEVIPPAWTDVWICPEPNGHLQLKAHEEQLKNLQQTARMLEMAGATEGQRLVAEAGVGHEKEYIRFWKRILKTRP